MKYKKLYIISVFSIFLLSCQSNNLMIVAPSCFESEDQARKIAHKLIDAGYFERVNYWVASTSGKNENKGLVGLMYAGFNPIEHCESGFPILITVDTSIQGNDHQHVRTSATIVYKQMLKELPPVLSKLMVSIASVLIPLLNKYSAPFFDRYGCSKNALVPLFLSQHVLNKTILQLSISLACGRMSSSVISSLPVL